MIRSPLERKAESVVDAAGLCGNGRPMREAAMPVVQITLVEGYDDAVKARLCRAVASAVRGVIPARPEATTVYVQAVSRAGYLRGDGPPNPAPPLPDPAETVTAFLRAMERRDLAAAAAMTGEGFAMTFPGPARFTALEALVAWSRPRYRGVAKTFERIDAMPAEDGAVVYALGTLAGEWPDGAAFSGIRFIDRFELRDGLIVRQDVWNDLAEHRAAR